MAKLKPNQKLTEQQKLFVQEYFKLRCKNAKQAAINAGYSPKTAVSQACQLLNKTKVLGYLEELKSQLVSDLRQEFIYDAIEAREIMYSIMKDKGAQDTNRIQVARDFLDRAGFGPQKKIEISGTLETEQSKLDAIISQLGDKNENT